jgi:hypothetical protein
MSTTEEVILCSSCAGKGYIWESEMTDYHKREYDTFKVNCKSCDGSGRRIKKTTITYEKFVDSTTA